MSTVNPPTFAILAQRAEMRRVALWAATLASLLLLNLGRRALDGSVMGTDTVFWPTLAVLTLALCGQLWLWPALRRADGASTRLVSKLARLITAADVGVPLALLTILALHSPRGPLAAASAPELLLLPLLALLSVLRLRPFYTLGIGLVGAFGHAALVWHAALIEHPTADQHTVYFAYSIVLGLIALAGMQVARAVQQYVRHAADEAAERYRIDRELAELQRDLAIAREIQQGLLPTHPPRFPGFDIAGMSRPANDTGGDYYDWQPLPDGRLMVCLADVSGHGIGPALVMAVCRAYARASATLIGDPSALLRRINRLLQPDLPEDRFITFALVELQPEGGLRLVSAGHGPTLLFEAATGHIRQYGSHGLPLGINFGFLPPDRYEPATTLHLAEGDILVLLTDGFYEWQRAGDAEQVGIERLEKALRYHAAQPAAAIVAALDRTSCDFAAGQKQQDDMTAVVIKREQRKDHGQYPDL